ncbi:glycosyltransferase [Kushneria aurantia]|uniref:Glycosyltransferase n=1 Tax=Kushneria aurantia TaxID=504092 RepID=A0ABV6FYV7_9GAMM|nr:glycosyltransferase [Kushneria aurantia]
MTFTSEDCVRLEESRLFEADWYRRVYADVARSGLSAWQHFCHHGWLLNRCPGPGFDPAAYLKAHTDVEKAGHNALQHYLRFGRQEGRRIFPAAIEAGRRDEKPPARSADSASPAAPRKSGGAVIATTIPQPSSDEARQLSRSEWFDGHWYLSEYADVAHRAANPAEHYLRHGAAELRDPGPHFETGFYLRQCPSLRETGENPLLHFLREGQQQGLLPRPARQRQAWWESLAPSSPLPFDIPATLSRLMAQAAPPAVILPVYNAVEEVEVCLAALIRNTRTACRIIVIDDASPDPAVAALLAQYRDVWPFECYRNAHNLGFTATVNRGIALAGRSDVVLLNSDTEVTPGWLRRLRMAAWSQSRVATVTPVSDNAGAFSVPEQGTNALPNGVSFDSAGLGLAQTALRHYPSVPTGNGFCLYVRRDCLDAVGALDADAFPRGYGEENDFCMRAGRDGWCHLIDDATFIHHVRSASFGEQKTALMEAGRAVIDRRYPEYARLVRDHFGAQPLRDVRARVAAVSGRLAAGAADAPQGPTPARPRWLFVISTRTGGTPQTNRDLMQALEQEAECFVLRCNSRVLTLHFFSEGIETEVERYLLETPLSAFPHRSAEYDARVFDWLVRYDFELLHVRHIAWHGLGLVEVARALGLPVVFSFHDFYSICPTTKLLDAQNRFCAGRCTAGEGECKHDLWPAGSLPPLRHRAIKAWQGQFAQVLARCDAFVTTTPSARRYLQQIFPQLTHRPFAVIPHGRDFESLPDLACEPTPGAPLRVVFPGNISFAKGGEWLRQLGEVARQHHLELHLLGKVSSDIRLPDTVVNHGSYAREEFHQRLAEIRPHAGAVLSMWPETYCHTLTELWAAGVPVVGLDIGAVGDRMEEVGGGWKVAMEPTLDTLLATLRRVADPVCWRERHAAVLRWQRESGRAQTTAQMASRYQALYRYLLHDGWKKPWVDRLPDDIEEAFYVPAGNA